MLCPIDLNQQRSPRAPFVGHVEKIDINLSHKAMGKNLSHDMLVPI